MKIKTVYSFVIMTLLVVLLSACPLNLLPTDGTIDLSDIPDFIKVTFNINFEPGIGTVTISDSGIKVERGNQADFGGDTTAYLRYHQNAQEFDTDRLIEQGYSLSSNYVHPDSEHPIFTLICTKGSNTIKYIFNIYPNDIPVHKSVNNVQLGDDISKPNDYITYLTWIND